ncbi:MAG: DUF4291 domain-containing protein [Burkholderiales bacterium]|nr:DUF4291 domain-containing protein [Anaerolineae bacterium]
MTERQIYAAYDDGGVYVYQAFTPETVRAALEKGTFGRGFGLDRMTWIKPSFGWMLYRSGYATKSRQEAILKIRLSHDGFLAILRESVETSFNPRVFASEDAWRLALKQSPVRHQWDPERLLNGYKHPADRRAIQIGIEDWIVHKYVNEWIIGLGDVTELAHAIKQAVDSGKALPPVPDERVYAVDDELSRRLGITR